MKLNVKLYGTLSHSFDEYNQKSGLKIVVSDGMTVHDLLSHLDLLSRGVGMILMDGRPVKKGSKLIDGAQIRIFQPIFGG